jgi:tartrate-resistant acid phosphatase type 5
MASSPYKEPLLADFANLSRRGFLRQTFAFSAMAALRPGALLAQAGGFALPNAGAQHMFMIGDWGTDVEFDQQKTVAASMAKWMDGSHVRPGSMFLLGDNWYGHLHGGLDDSRWKSQFEDMYPADRYPGPAYAVLGNHDYERTSEHDKVELQLQYGAAKHSRWTMPAKWYTFKYPQQEPIVTFICLDSNYPGTKAWDFKPGSYLMSRAEADQQDAWLAAELAKPRTTPFVAVIAHHPLFTNGIHRDNRILIPRWDRLLRDHKVDFYITGHDHDLQHIEFDGHPTSFVISGGGGAELVNWSVPPENRGPYGGRVVGFSHLEMTKDAMVLRHIGANAQQLHAFRKTVAGRVEILKS